jgi:carbon monoxide dehydrogenase subunit G
VWQTLIDVEHVAPCLPGAAVTGRNDDGSYNGTFTIKIGPTTASYSGKLAMEQVDEAAHVATMQAQGNDRRGQGGAKATIVSRVVAAGEDSTRVEVDTDYHITGRLARFGRGGMIEDISERLLREFATRLQASLTGQSAGAAFSSAVADAPAAPPPTDAPVEPPPTDAPVEPPPTEAPVQAESAPAPMPAAPPAPAPVPAAPQAPVPATAAPPAPVPATAAPPAPVPATAAPPAPVPVPADQSPTSEPVEGLSILGSVMLKRLKQNPAALLGVLGALLLLMLLRRRR